MVADPPGEAQGRGARQMGERERRSQLLFTSREFQQ